MKKLFNYFFASRCLFCLGASGREQQLCSACEQELPLLQHACNRCGIPLQQSQELCGNCLKSPPAYDVTLAIFAYIFPIDFAITSLKFHGKLGFAELLGELLADRLRDYYATHAAPEIIIPMPLHPLRLRERGFNQALEIARVPAKILQIPLDKYSWRREKNTVWQSSLSARERRKNISNAFRAPQNFPYRHVAVLDDVVTTGATINEFCRILRQKTNVQQIDVWCCARTKRQQW